MENISYDAIVVGSGAAGFCAAVRLKEMGKNVAIVTENVNYGTSRNTGSDKQTYYKLSLGGDCEDSVMHMAENLFSFGAVDGDNALCEAALSARCFLNLAEAGVPFPTNRYGEFVGYKTDHDPYKRATSAGPLTSKFMTEALENKACALGIPILDSMLTVEILKEDNEVFGLIVLNKKIGSFSAISTKNVILATGGPAGIYADSVYPESQHGAMSLAIDAEAKLQNLTEWQYGLASVRPRWNVSGTYMQVLPRFVSIDNDGNEYEFLEEYFTDPYSALDLIFFKGYQWPFDCKKVMSGSSVIDLIVFYEASVKRRKVYLDFTKNPFGLKKIDFEKLSSEAYEYLKNADALFGEPIDRLTKMNRPAIELYAEKGVDICNKYLEIALCAQHHNGGIAVDMWWQTSVKGLFAIGECAGTHGIARPGGSALNAGQVGALRASLYIASKENDIDKKTFSRLANCAILKHELFAQELLQNDDNIALLIKNAKRKMSDIGGAIRDRKNIKGYLSELELLIKNIGGNIGVSSPRSVYKAYIYRDILLSQCAVLTAMYDYDAECGSSRGSAMICSEYGYLKSGLDEMFRFKMSDNISADKIQEIYCKSGKFIPSWRHVRQIPREDSFFENVWKGYRENKNIY